MTILIASCSQQSYQSCSSAITSTCVAIALRRPMMHRRRIDNDCVTGLSETPKHCKARINFSPTHVPRNTCHGTREIHM